MASPLRPPAHQRFFSYREPSYSGSSSRLAREIVSLRTESSPLPNRKPTNSQPRAQLFSNGAHEHDTKIDPLKLDLPPTPQIEPLPPMGDFAEMKMGDFAEMKMGDIAHDAITLIIASSRRFTEGYLNGSTYEELDSSLHELHGEITAFRNLFHDMIGLLELEDQSDIGRQAIAYSYGATEPLLEEFIALAFNEGIAAPRALMERIEIFCVAYAIDETGFGAIAQDAAASALTKLSCLRNICDVLLVGRTWKDLAKTLLPHATSPMATVFTHYLINGFKADSRTADWYRFLTSDGIEFRPKERIAQIHQIKIGERIYPMREATSPTERNSIEVEHRGKMASVIIEGHDLIITPHDPNTVTIDGTPLPQIATFRTGIGHHITLGGERLVIQRLPRHLSMDESWLSYDLAFDDSHAYNISKNRSEIPRKFMIVERKDGRMAVRFGNEMTEHWQLISEQNGEAIVAAGEIEQTSPFHFQFSFDTNHRYDPIMNDNLQNRARGARTILQQYLTQYFAGMTRTTAISVNYLDKVEEMLI